MLLARERLNLYSSVLHLRKRRACQEASCCRLNLLNALQAAYACIARHGGASKRLHLNNASLLLLEHRTLLHLAHQSLQSGGRTPTAYNLMLKGALFVLAQPYVLNLPCGSVAVRQMNTCVICTPVILDAQCRTDLFA